MLSTKSNLFSKIRVAGSLLQLNPFHECPGFNRHSSNGRNSQLYGIYTGNSLSGCSPNPSGINSLHHISEAGILKSPGDGRQGGGDGESR
jgi:hypothetical protein